MKKVLLFEDFITEASNVKDIAKKILGELDDNAQLFPDYIPAEALGAIEAALKKNKSLIGKDAEKAAKQIRMNLEEIGILSNTFSPMDVELMIMNHLNESTTNEALNPAEFEKAVKDLAHSMPNHTKYDYDKGPSEEQILTAMKKYQKGLYKYTDDAQKKEVVDTVIKILTESLDESVKIKDIKVGTILNFKDGEVWKVTRVIGNSSNPRGFFAKPHDEKTKKHNVSMEIEMTPDFLEKELESVSESKYNGNIAGDAAEYIAKELSQYVKGIIDQPNDNVTYFHLKDKSSKGKVIKTLLDVYGLEAEDGGTQFSPSATIKFDNDQILESSMNEAIFTAKDFGKTLVVYKVDMKAKELYVVDVNSFLSAKKDPSSTVAPQRFQGAFGMKLEDDWKKEFGDLPNIGDILPFKNERALESLVNEAKELDRDAMMDMMSDKYQIKTVRTTEEFNGQTGGIWMAGDNEETMGGKRIFDYYNKGAKYQNGVLKNVVAATEKAGWWFSWNDPGTIMLWPKK